MLQKSIIIPEIDIDGIATAKPFEFAGMPSPNSQEVELDGVLATRIIQLGKDSTNTKKEINFLVKNYSRSLSFTLNIGTPSNVSVTVEGFQNNVAITETITLPSSGITIYSVQTYDKVTKITANLLFGNWPLDNVTLAVGSGDKAFFAPIFPNLKKKVFNYNIRIFEMPNHPIALDDLQIYNSFLDVTKTQQTFLSQISSANASSLGLERAQVATQNISIIDQETEPNASWLNSEFLVNPTRGFELTLRFNERPLRSHLVYLTNLQIPTDQGQLVLIHLDFVQE